MKVYQAELDAGLGDFFKSAYGSIRCESVVEEFKHEVKQEILDKIAKATNMGQIDLYYARSILATSGWNKNTDVLLPSEMWAARHTAEDKPFNFEHNESDIIGHSTSNYIIDANNNVVADDTPIDKLPLCIHTVTSWVLYKHWEKIELSERMQQIIAEIAEKKWYVSMEALFPHFDYAIITPEGKEYTIARTEDTAFLTKHLRAYGGDGVYDNNKVGRILRNLVFKGQGLVRKPANPNSIIFANVKDFNGVENNSVIQSTGSTQMPENSVLEQENKSLKEQLVQLTAANKDLAIKVTESSAKANESKITSLEKDLVDAKAALDIANKSVKDLTSKVESTEAVVKELTTKLDTLTAEKATLASQLVQIEADKKLSERVSKLVSVGMKKEDAEAKAKVFATVSDEVFETITAIAKVPANKSTDTQVLNNVQASEAVVVPNPGTKEHETATAALQDSIVKYLGSRTNKQSNKGDE